jgi:DNA-binding NtrC family response regulator
MVRKKKMDAPATKATALEPTKTLGLVVREHVEQVLAQCRGNKTKAAKVLGINRRSLYRMIERWRKGDFDPFN